KCSKHTLRCSCAPIEFENYDCCCPRCLLRWEWRPRTLPAQSACWQPSNGLGRGSGPGPAVPALWVRLGDIGDSSYRRHGLHFWAERIFDWFEHLSLQIKVSQIIIHKAHQPNVVVDFSDADGLIGEDRTEVDFLAAQTDSTTTRDHDGFVVEWIVDVRQPLVGTCGRLIDLRRALHVQGLVRPLVVEDLDEFVEPSLLLQEIGSSRFGGFFLQGQMHAFMAAVLLGMPRFDAFDANPQAEPPHRELA